MLLSSLAILMIHISVTMSLVGGLSGMSILYMMRIFLSILKPKRKPDLANYMLWTDSVHLTDSSCFLHGPFNFDSRSDVISANQFVALHHWEYLLTSCITLGILPLTLSSLIVTKLKKRRKK